MEVSDIKAIEHRLESIESILRMLLFNSVFTDNEIENIKRRISEQIQELLSPIGLSGIRLNYIEGKYYIFADIDHKCKIEQIKNTYVKAIQVLDLPLVFVFKTLHPSRKRALENAGISYALESGRICIFEYHIKYKESVM